MTKQQARSIVRDIETECKAARWLIESPEREQAVTELLEIRHVGHRWLEIAIFMALASIRNGESTHRAITVAEKFLKRQGK